MSLMITGQSSHAPVGKSGICTPSDGYRALAAAVLFSAIKEDSMDFLLSDAAETYFALLDIDPDAAIEAIRRKNDHGAR